MASARVHGKSHHGGKPPTDPGAVERTLRMRAEGRWSVGEILLATGLSRATYFRYARKQGEEAGAWMRCCERAFLFLGGVPHVTDCSMLSASYSGLGETRDPAPPRELLRLLGGRLLDLPAPLRAGARPRGRARCDCRPGR